MRDDMADVFGDRLYK